MSQSPIQIDYHGQTVRVVGTRERPEWIAADVCAVLSISNPRDTLSRFDDDEKGVALTDTPGGRQELLTVTEPGLYRLIMRSRKAESRVFRRWVFHEVLPSIRAFGCYPPPTSEIGLFGPIFPAGLERMIVPSRPANPITVSVDASEKLIPLSDVCDIAWLPSKPARSTPTLWHRYGRRGIYLETIRCRGRLFTTEAAVLIFMLRCAAPNPSPDAPVSITVNAHSERARHLLAATGIASGAPSRGGESHT